MLTDQPNLLSEPTSDLTATSPRPGARRPQARIRLPWQGRTPQSAHASFLGAQAAFQSGSAVTVAAAYLRLLRARGATGATDWEAAEALRVQRSSINSVRNTLMWPPGGAPAVYPIQPRGFRPGPPDRHGRQLRNTVWVLVGA